MASKALIAWETDKRLQFDRLLAAHRAVAGQDPGRKWATAEICHALTVANAAQFQSFCRELHDECVDFIAAAASPEFRVILRQSLTSNRHLDKGNPWPNQIREDFKRFDMDIWQAVGCEKRPINNWQRRVTRLEQVCIWRNAIAHEDFDLNMEQKAKVHDAYPGHLVSVRKWRNACNRLAIRMDGVATNHLANLLNTPWQ